MAPDAPALFSTITVVFHMSASFWPTTRASRSVPPPGAKPTMMRTGWVGRLCARAMGSATVAATPVMKVLRCIFSLSWVGLLGKTLCRLLQGDWCRMAGEVLHGGGDTGACE